ncbi:ribosome maturation factor RimM [Egicoccus halophilus]|uniref:Ribosome maturation factor RimM n=1 Tax=Egicoccus halophilus TaxID=1670830 RepID=A0A8J3A8D8_9ACTN|nr:ribosome maturation factor RimM [Egicoccus halophilus]GGI06476.1 ribosome maturation factor RimM [Egicoccus halophilus]
MTADLVVVGRVVKAHGIRGELVIDVLSDVPGRFDTGGSVVLAGARRTITGSRPHQGRLLVRLDGVSDRTAAERLRGAELLAPAADVSDEETYYAHELVGMAVVDEQGASLGAVSGLIELPEAAGYDLLEVTRADGGTWLLPAVDDFVEIAEDEQGTERLRLVDPPEGLVSGEAANAAPDA